MLLSVLCGLGAAFSSLAEQAWRRRGGVASLAAAALRRGLHVSLARFATGACLRHSRALRAATCRICPALAAAHGKTGGCCGWATFGGKTAGFGATEKQTACGGGVLVRRVSLTCRGGRQAARAFSISASCLCASAFCCFSLCLLAYCAYPDACFACILACFLPSLPSFFLPSVACHWAAGNLTAAFATSMLWCSLALVLTAFHYMTRTLVPSTCVWRVYLPPSWFCLLCSLPSTLLPAPHTHHTYLLCLCVL